MSAPRPRPPASLDAETASETARLDPRDLERLAIRVADLVAERLDAPRAGRWLTASEVAALYGVSRDWAYANASSLGAVRLGDGPRSRLRFDAAKVAAALSSREESRRSNSVLEPMATGNRGRRRATSGRPGAHTAPNLLPIKARDG